MGGPTFATTGYAVAEEKGQQQNPLTCCVGGSSICSENGAAVRDVSANLRANHWVPLADCWAMSRVHCYPMTMFDEQGAVSVCPLIRTATFLLGPRFLQQLLQNSCFCTKGPFSGCTNPDKLQTRGQDRHAREGDGAGGALMPTTTLPPRMQAAPNPV